MMRFAALTTSYDFSQLMAQRRVPGVTPAQISMGEGLTVAHVFRLGLPFPQLVGYLPGFQIGNGLQASHFFLSLQGVGCSDTGHGQAQRAERQEGRGSRGTTPR